MIHFELHVLRELSQIHDVVLIVIVSDCFDTFCGVKSMNRPFVVQGGVKSS